MKNQFLWGNYDYNKIPGLNQKIKEKIEKDEKEKFLQNLKNFNENNNNLELNNNNNNNINQNINNNNNKENNIENKKNKNSNIIINTGETQFSANISTFVTKVIGKETVYFFKIDCFSEITGKTWFVYHKYQDFIDLSFIFSIYFLNCPTNFKNIPLTKLNIEKIITLLNDYLIFIINRSDLFTNKYTQTFLKLKNHFPDINIYHPLEIYNLNNNNKNNINEINFPITNLFYYELTKLLFIGTGNINNSIVNNINEKTKKIYSKVKNKINNLFQTQTLNNNFNEINGELIIYNIINTYNMSETLFIKLFKYCFRNSVSSMDYFYGKNYLCIGLENGEIYIFKVYITESSSESKNFCDCIITLNNIHYNKILSVIINFDLGYIYSFAKNEKIFKISDLNCEKIIKEINIIKSGIEIVNYFISFERILIIDNEGNLYIIDILTDSLNPKIVQIIHKNFKEFCIMKIFNINNLYIMFFSDIKSNINIYYIEDINIIKINQNDIKLIDNKNKNIIINDIIITNKNEILIAFSNGSINIFLFDLNVPIYVIDNHLKNCTKIIFVQNKRILFSGGEDKCIKMCQLPLDWSYNFIKKNKYNYEYNYINNLINYMYENNLIYNHKNRNNNYKDIYKGNKYYTDKEIFSEDLDGWDLY